MDIADKTIRQTDWGYWCEFCPSGHELITGYAEEALEHALTHIRELHRRLEAAKADGAVEAYEAEAAYWEEMRERALSMADLSTSYQFRRRRDEARERAAALRKQADATCAGVTR